MLKGVLAVLVVGILICSGGAVRGADPNPEASLKKDFPRLRLERLQLSPIKGIYEVETDSGIVYYAPEASCLLTGDIITKDGKNLTQQRRDETLLARVKTLPLERALKIGAGKRQVIEFTDPDCGYCRKAATVLDRKENITRHIFFFPLSRSSADKVRHILCSPDRMGAYQEAVSGRLDKKPLNLCDSAEVQSLMKLHRDSGRRLGLEGTPFFIIEGQIVAGADIPLIEELLPSKGQGKNKDLSP